MIKKVMFTRMKGVSICSDLMIIGSRGLNSLQEMVLGSVSYKVIKRVQCPVLIVK
jgi:nucleotide-binding universal stress UspA family protein